MSDKIPSEPTTGPEDSNMQNRVAKPDQLAELQRIIAEKKQKDLEKKAEVNASWSPPPSTKEDSEKTAQVLKAEEPPFEDEHTTNFDTTNIREAVKETQKPKGMLGFIKNLINK